MSDAEETSGIFRWGGFICLHNELLGRLHLDRVYAGLTDWEGVPLPGDITECVLQAVILRLISLDVAGMM